jgi:hypothetical protein
MEGPPGETRWRPFVFLGYFGVFAGACAGVAPICYKALGRLVTDEAVANPVRSGRKQP